MRFITKCQWNLRTFTHIKLWKESGIKKNQALHRTIVVHRLHANPPRLSPLPLSFRILRFGSRVRAHMPRIFTASTEALTAPPFQMCVLRWIPRNSDRDYFQIAPETISERPKSIIFLGGHTTTPPYMARKARVSTPIAKILRSPLYACMFKARGKGMAAPIFFVKTDILPDLRVMLSRGLLHTRTRQPFRATLTR